MRQLLLRIGAGILAIGFVWVVAKSDMSPRDLVLTASLALVFAVYATAGLTHADRLFARLTGQPTEPATTKTTEEERD